MVQFVKGQKVPLEYGGEATIVSDGELGHGAQGKVYLVEYEGKRYAMKWYTSNLLSSNKDFKRNLDKNIDQGSPEKSFVWPLYLTKSIDGSFGYLMDLIDTDKHISIEYILKTYKVENLANNRTRKVPVRFKSVNAMVSAGIYIVKAFRELHRTGKSFQDLNDGGLYFDLETGEARICDCDNICSDYESVSNIAGKQGYMAPEVVMRRSRPNVNTDKFSLAIILFKLLLKDHPLEGKNLADLDGGFSDKAARDMYGDSAVFVYDPDDDSNRPDPSQKNLINFWNYYPQYIRDAFTQVFTKGLKEPSQRLNDSEWLELLIRLYSDIVECECGRPATFVSVNTTKGGLYTCAKCGAKSPIFDIGRYTMALNSRTVIHPCQIDPSSDDFTSVVGRIVENTQHPGIYGFKNLSNEFWLTDRRDKVLPGKGTVLRSELMLDFGKGLRGKIRRIE